MVFMAAMATLSPVATSCKSTSFKGSSEIGPRTAGSVPGLPGAPGSSGTPNPGTPGNPFSNPGGNPGTSSDLPHAVIPTAPLQIAYDAHAKPTNAPDLLKFINKYPQFPQAAYTVYFAGFDHIFLGNQWCATSPFACDSRNWDNRDDNGVVFSCKVADCPNGGPGTELHFAGEDN